MPGHDAQREVDQEQLPEELRQPEPLRVLGPDPRGLVAGHDRRQADRDRDEEEVVDGDDAELPAGKVKWVHADSLVEPLGSGVSPSGPHCRDLGPRSARALRPCPGAPPLPRVGERPRSGALRLPGIPSPGTGPHRRLGRSGGGALWSSAPRSPRSEPQADDPTGRRPEYAASRSSAPAPAAGSTSSAKTNPRPGGMIGSASPATYATTSSETSIVWPLPWARSHPCSNSSIARTAGLNAAGTSLPGRVGDGAVEAARLPGTQGLVGHQRDLGLERALGCLDRRAGHRAEGGDRLHQVDRDLVTAQLRARGRLGLVLGRERAQHGLDRGERGVPDDDRVEALRRPGPLVGAGVALDREPLEPLEVVLPARGVAGDRLRVGRPAWVTVSRLPVGGRVDGHRDRRGVRRE